MTEKYESRVTQMTIVRTGETIIDELAIYVTVEDECAGEFIAVSTLNSRKDTVTFDKDEWPILREIIDKMIEDLRK